MFFGNNISQVVLYDTCMFDGLIVINKQREFSLGRMGGLICISSECFQNVTNKSFRPEKLTNSNSNIKSYGEIKTNVLTSFSQSETKQYGDSFAIKK